MYDVASVVVARWPSEAERRGAIASRRLPCMWLVEPGVAPPVVEAWEDWVRLPAHERDVKARIESLKRRACRPELVDDSILRNGFGSALLPAREASVATELINRHPHPVSREQLEALLWSDGPPTTRALEDLVYRLRRRIKPLHLAISYSRGTGFAIGVATEATPAATDDSNADWNE
jgi:hypothetical protein